MNAAVNAHEVSGVEIASRVDANEWSRVPAHLDARTVGVIFHHAK
jgi:hypothetical protein